MAESTSMSAATEQMKTVKAAWDKAPSGPKKDAALKHYQAAEKARSADNDAECIKELNAATSAWYLSFCDHNTSTPAQFAGVETTQQNVPSTDLPTSP